MPVKQLFDPATEGIAAHFADDQTEVLQQATDLVLEITLDLDQLGPATRRSYLMTMFGGGYGHFVISSVRLTRIRAGSL